MKGKKIISLLLALMVLLTACSGSSMAQKADYAVREEKSGCCGSVLDLFWEGFNHRPQVFRGPLEEECEALLRDFFEQLRGGDSWRPPFSAGKI